MRYLHHNITVSVELSISEIDNLYYIINGEREIDQKVKTEFLKNIKTIVENYKQSVDVDLRLYDATDKERIAF